MNTPPVAVLILNFNGEKYIRQCLKSVCASDYPNFRVLVVDNHSSDNSLRIIEDYFPDVEILRMNSNVGFAKAYNYVIRRVEEEFFVLLNNDVEVNKSGMRELVKYAEPSDVAATPSKMLYLDDERIVNSAGGCCDIYGVGWSRGNGKPDDGRFDRVQEVFYGVGGATLIKKSAWEDVGPFDGRYFMYAEDLDWCWRAIMRGYKILYVPTSIVYHKWHGSSESLPIVYFMERNWMCNLIKNYSLKSLLKIAPRYFGIKFFKSMWLLLRGNGEEKLAFLKAMIWNITNLKGSLRRRSEVQKRRTIPDSEVQEHMFKSSYELLLWRGIVKHPILKRYGKGRLSMSFYQP